MACKKNKYNSECGCGDKPIKTPCSCVENNCNGLACSEMFDLRCIFNTGNDSYLNLEDGGVFAINNGDNVFDILQKFAVIMNNKQIDSANVPYGLSANVMKDNTAKINWKVDSDGDMVLYYKKQEDDFWETIDVEEKTYTLQNLVSDSIYEVYVSVEGIESMIVKFKTF